MIATLNEKGSSVLIDLMSHLIESDRLIFTPEFERAIFDRTVEDLHLMLSDLDDTFTNFFYNKPVTTVWQVRLIDGGRTLFMGEILNRSILFKLKSESLELNIFSNLKTFWDRAKTQAINPNPTVDESGVVYTTLEYILKREFLRPVFSDLFSSVKFDPTSYGARPIRGWGNASNWSDPTIGDNGRYRELAGSSVPDPNDPYRIIIPNASTKGYDLLSAYAVYYNAEFYIDYDANALVMHSRNQVINATPVNGAPINIDSLLMDEEEPEAQIYEDDRYDYLLVPHYIAPPSSPTLDGYNYYTDTRGLTGNVSYVLTVLLRYLGLPLLFELPASTPLSVDIKSILNAPFTKTKSVGVKVRLPTDFPLDTYSLRYLYRTKQGGGDYYLHSVYDAHTQNIVINDVTSDASLTNIHPPTRFHSAMAYLRYDESTAKWESYIRYDEGGANPPSGKILEVIPRLQFREIYSNSIKDFSVGDGVAHFGMEAFSPSYDAIVKEQFKDLFVTKHKLLCLIQSTNVKVGDAVSASSLALPFPQNSMMVKRAEVDIIKERTRVELISA